MLFPLITMNQIQDLENVEYKQIGNHGFQTIPGRIKRHMKQRRVCFLTGTRIGLPIGFFVILKIIFVLALCFELYTSSSYVVLEKRDEEESTPCVSEDKKQLVALLLSIFVGEFGVDQFYIGNIGLGVGKLLTCGGCGIWWLVDVILFAINDHYKDKNECMLKPI